MTSNSPVRRRGPQTFTSLRHRDFRLLWTSSVLNAASSWIQQVTLGWLTYDLTDSALAAGLVFGMRSLPSLLIGPLGGVLGDRFERRKGLLINSGYMSVLALGFALLDAARNPAPVEVDGGIDADTVSPVVRAGAEILVAGHAVFGGGEPEAAVRALKAAAQASAAPGSRRA